MVESCRVCSARRRFGLQLSHFGGLSSFEHSGGRLVLCACVCRPELVQRMPIKGSVRSRAIGIPYKIGVRSRSLTTVRFTDLARKPAMDAPSRSSGLAEDLQNGFPTQAEKNNVSCQSEPSAPFLLRRSG